MPRALSDRELARIVRELSRVQSEMEKYADQLEDRFHRGLRQAHARSLNRITSILSDAPDFSSLNTRQRMQWWLDHQQAIDDALVRSGYPSVVKGYVDSLPRFGEWVKELASAQGESFLEFPKATLTFLRGRATEQFMAAGARGNAALSDLLYGEVFSGKANSAAIAKAREALPEVYQKYAGTYARTNHFRFARELSLQQADALGLEHFLYTGPVDEKLRPFCRKVMASPVRTRDEIAKMNNGQGPEVANVFTNGGGYNCRHSWVAISERLAEKLKTKVKAGSPEREFNNTPVKGWNANSKTKAAQWAQKQGLAGTVSYEGLSQANIRVVNEHLGTLMREFPGIRIGYAGSSDGVTDWMIENKLGALKPDSLRSAGLTVSPADGTDIFSMTFASAKWGTKETTAEYMASQAEAASEGYFAFNVPAGIKRTIYHEFGHAIDIAKSVRKMDAFKAIAKEFEGRISSELAGYSAKYADLREVPSEAFAEYMLADHPRELALKVGRLMFRAFGMKPPR